MLPPVETLRRDLKAGKIMPVYVLTGAEELLKREAVTLISDAVLDGSPRDFNELRLMWKETSAEDVVAACRTFPMLGGRRLVVVKGADAIKAKDAKPLVTYLKDPAETSTLLVVGQQIDMRQTWVKAAKKVGWVKKLDAPYQSKIPQWIRGRARDKGVEIDGAAAALLGDVIGNRLAALDEALERLILYVSKPDMRPHITLQDVENCIAPTRVHTVFELTDALGRRKVGDAIRILEAMIAAREAPIRILAMVARHFRRLWVARDGMDQNLAPEAIGQSLNVHGYFLKDFLRQAGMFQHADYAMLIERFYETDRLLKSSRAPDEMHMHRLLLDICSSR